MEIILENDFAKLYENGNIELKIDFRDFDISHEEYFYFKNNPEVESANIKNKFNEKVYLEVLKKCNESGEYTIDCFNGRYTVRKTNDVEQIHYDAMTDEEKAQYDKQKQQQAIYEEIQELKTYLSDTDYIVTKINEVMAEGTEEEISAIKEEYKEQLIKRKEARKRINELEKELGDLEKK